MEKKRVWSKEDTIDLVNYFEGFPELWQIKSKIYRDRIKKQKALIFIAEKFGTTEGEIQRKLHNLRTQANQEWNKIKKRKSGEGGTDDEIYTSSWEYFESLKFLIDQNTITPRTEDILLQVSKNIIRSFNKVCFIFTKKYIGTELGLNYNSYYKCLYCQETSPSAETK